MTGPTKKHETARRNFLLASAGAVAGAALLGIRSAR